MTANLIDQRELEVLGKRERTNLINSLSGYKSANLIGTINTQGQTNLALFSSVVHLGADPALVGMVSRPDSVPRHTLENIRETKKFTINHVNARIFEQAHHSSARYDRDISEFEACHLNEQFTEFAAPYVKESVIKFGLEFVEEKPIEVNGTVFIIGKILEIICPADLIQHDGNLDLVNSDAVAVSGLNRYHECRLIEQLEYAKPKKS